MRREWMPSKPVGRLDARVAACCMHAAYRCSFARLVQRFGCLHCSARTRRSEFEQGALELRQVVTRRVRYLGGQRGNFGGRRPYFGGRRRYFGWKRWYCEYRSKAPADFYHLQHRLCAHDHDRNRVAALHVQAFRHKSSSAAKTRRRAPLSPCV
eukprot:58667-Pleurochrysis_carterae.AAC.2